MGKRLLHHLFQDFTYTCGPAILGNTLWRNGIPGTMCANNNDGDILAQFDQKADRWFLSQNVFVSPYATCIAISDTNDANGTCHVWQFSVPGTGFPDYPKIGIWPTTGVNNGYYQAQNNFGPGGSGFRGPQICAYDRAALLAALPLRPRFASSCQQAKTACCLATWIPLSAYRTPRLEHPRMSSTLAA